MGAQSTKPLLYLDVDGVINVFDDLHPTPELEQEFVVTSDGIDCEVCIPAGTGRRLRALDQWFEVVWATTWEQRAVELLAPHLGIGERWRVLRFSTFPDIAHPLVKRRRLSDSVTRKLELLLYDAASRPFAVVDDTLYADALGAFRTRQRRVAPTLVIRPREWSGLTEGHFEHLLAFADRISAAPQGPVSVEAAARDAGDYIYDQDDADRYLGYAREFGDKALLDLVKADVEAARLRAGGELPDW